MNEIDTLAGRRLEDTDIAFPPDLAPPLGLDRQGSLWGRA